MNYNRPIGYRGKPVTGEDRAWEAGGFSQRYAMRNGKRYIRNDGNHILWVFKYPAGGFFKVGGTETYDVTEGRWIN